MDAAKDRILARIRGMSYIQLGSCKGFGIKIVDKITDPKTRMVLVEKDAKAPTKANWPAAVKALGLSWAQMHKGVVFGAFPP